MGMLRRAAGRSTRRLDLLSHWSRRAVAAPDRDDQPVEQFEPDRRNNGIRTVGSAGGVGVFLPLRPTFSGGGKSSGGNMSRSRNLDCMTRYQWFESSFLQR